LNSGTFASSIFSSIALASIACGNPVVDQKVAALGGEQEGVEQSEFHRPGQPCVLCHNPYYGASPEISLGGTIFADLNSFNPAANVEVIMTDTLGRSRTAVTNCIGNFFVLAEDWEPQFPVAVEIRYPTFTPDGTPLTDTAGAPLRKVKAMGSVVSRDGSCATCHTLYGRVPIVNQDNVALWYDSTGWIYCNEKNEVNPFPPLDPTCPGKPPRDASQLSATSTTTGGG
jgi:hypothetical protein